MRANHRVCVVAAVVLVLGVSAPAARAAWTTYRGNASRVGIDVSSSGSVPFSQAWASSNLSGDIYAEPLVYGGQVVVATEGDKVYALNESTGQITWRASAGTPVPAAELPCGDISPTVGITSTPVIDPASGRVFVVADTWDGTHASSIAHRIYAFNLANGSRVAGFPVVVDPPGSVPKAQLQRAALALDDGKIVIGYGGNGGDCGTYNGWLVAAPESGGPMQTFEVESGSTGGAIWGAGNGPVVARLDNLWVATGNGFGSTYGYQESVLELDPNLNLLDHWAPSTWESLDDGDVDLGSSDPLQLPGGLVFEIGKQGVGYLLSAASLGGTGGPPVFSAQVCGTGNGSFGGGIYRAGVIYVSCADGLRALSLNVTAKTFSPVSGWQLHGAAVGPPIFAGNLVWVTGWHSHQLFGLDPTTGSALVDKSTPAMEHFAVPAASDGKLFLASGETVEAYTVAHAAVVTPSVTSVGPSSGPSTGGTLVNITGNGLSAPTGVTFGTQSATFTSISNTQVAATTPAGSTGSVDVTVTTAAGTSSTSVADLYAYGAPTVSSFTPTSAITGSKVVITGTGFARGAVVRFGTRVSPSVTVLSGTSLQAVVPNGAASAPISVTNAAGVGTSSSNFSPTLSVTGFTPASGPAGTSVTINGIGFNSSSALKFNGTTATNVTHVSSTKLKATVPAAATTGPISVTNTTSPAGTVQSARSYTVS